MIRYRRIIQVVSLLVFVVLLSITKFPMEQPPSLVNVYVRMSPLHLFATLLNAWHYIPAFVPAIVLLALTVVFGRFFCGWVCPMGVTIDVTDRVLRPGVKKINDSKEPSGMKPVKYGVLTAVLVAAYFEANLAGWLDPQSLITRTYAMVILPGFQFMSDLMLRGLRPVPGLGSVSTGLRSFLQTTLYSLQQPVFHGMLATALIFLAITLLVYYNRRFWCRFLCPMGAILALTSRFSVFRRVVDADKCTGCGRCVRNCRMGAISKGGQQDFRGECIECFTCQSVCPEGAITFRPLARGVATLPVNFTRRTLVASFGAGVAAVPVARLATGVPSRSPIRPPGAGGDRGLDYFMQTCLRCGQCMRVCPTNAIHPAWFDSGFEGLWSPELSPINGYCEYNCNLCGLVCPSGAITPLTDIAKKHRQIGLAVFKKNRCIPWSRAEDCLCCEEHCPVPSKAIRFRTERMLNDAGESVDVKLPYVVEEECIGCGICENKCPLHGVRGIHVTGFMPQTSKPEKEEKTGGAGPGDLLPEMLAGWKAAYDTDTFGADNLFEFINGGAEIYYEYGYAAAATRDYERGDDSLSVDIFQMANPDAAYGILTYERPAGSESAGVGTVSYLATGMLGFTQADMYVKISYYGYGDEGEDMKAVAENISALLGRASEPPELIRRLPNGAGADAVIVAGPLTSRGFDPVLAQADNSGIFQNVKCAWYKIPDDRKKMLFIAQPGNLGSVKDQLTAIFPDAVMESMPGRDDIVIITIGME